jgi:hypothetical protein
MGVVEEVLRRWWLPLAALALASATPAAAAGTTGRTVVVALDEAAYRARDAALLAAKVDAAILEHQAVVDTGVTTEEGDRSVIVRVADVDAPADFLAGLQGLLAQHTNFDSTVSKAKVLEVRFAPTSAPAARATDVQRLKAFVQLLRPAIPGAAVTRAGAVITVRVPTANARKVDHYFDRWAGVAEVTRTTDDTWRVVLRDLPDPPPTNPIGAFVRPTPVKRLTWPLDVAFEIQQELREPLDLVTDERKDGIDVFIVDADTHADYIAALTDAFAAAPGFDVQWREGEIVSIVERGAVSASATMALDEQVQSLIAPPFRVDRDAAGVTLRPAVTSQGVAAVAAVASQLSGAPGLHLHRSPDQSLRIDMAPDEAHTARPEPDEFARFVRANVAAWGLAATVDPAGSSQVAVHFSREADAAAFARRTADHDGFAIAAVDSPITDDPTWRPPPRDRAFPQLTGRERLWLAPSDLGGDAVAEAHQSVDQNGQPDIEFSLTNAGRALFAELTATHVGQRIAVVVDGVVIEAPRVVTPIFAGQGEITGKFSVESAQALAQSITEASNGAALKVVEVR